MEESQIRVNNYQHDGALELLMRVCPITGWEKLDGKCCEASLLTLYDEIIRLYLVEILSEQCYYLLYLRLRSINKEWEGKIKR